MQEMWYLDIPRRRGEVFDDFIHRPVILYPAV